MYDFLKYIYDNLDHSLEYVEDRKKLVEKLLENYEGILANSFGSEQVKNFLDNLSSYILKPKFLNEKEKNDYEKPKPLLTVDMKDDVVKPKKLIYKKTRRKFNLDKFNFKQFFPHYTEEEIEFIKNVFIQYEKAINDLEIKLGKNLSKEDRKYHIKNYIEQLSKEKGEKEAKRLYKKQSKLLLELKKEYQIAIDLLLHTLPETKEQIEYVRRYIENCELADTEEEVLKVLIKFYPQLKKYSKYNLNDDLWAIVSDFEDSVNALTNYEKNLLSLLWSGYKIKELAEIQLMNSGHSLDKEEFEKTQQILYKIINRTIPNKIIKNNIKRMKEIARKKRIKSNIMFLKRCKICGELKPESEFYEDKTMKDGRKNVCKSCFL